MWQFQGFETLVHLCCKPKLLVDSKAGFHLSEYWEMDKSLKKVEVWGSNADPGPWLLRLKQAQSREKTQPGVTNTQLTEGEQAVQQDCSKDVATLRARFIECSSEGMNSGEFFVDCSLELTYNSLIWYFCVGLMFLYLFCLKVLHFRLIRPGVSTQKRCQTS